jgi:ubiquinone/menaquinone biosynthesis C-methylase UbiE
VVSQKRSFLRIIVIIATPARVIEQLFLKINCKTKETISLNIFFELFTGLPRQGPGSSECTQQAFAKLTGLAEKPRILDIGCGTGGQTIEIAKLSSGYVTALDTHQPYLDELELTAKQTNLLDKIYTINRSMFNMDFNSEQFDLIWAEGSIYIMGFAAGLETCRRFLKQGGYMAVSELSWLKNNPPQQLVKYWKKEYPGMKSMKENLAIINQAGFTEIAHFILPERAWWDEFYTPLEERAQILQKKYNGNTKKLQVVNETLKEIELYRKFPEWYGYVFYIMQKTSVNPPYN